MIGWPAIAGPWLILGMAVFVTRMVAGNEPLAR